MYHQRAKQITPLVTGVWYHVAEVGDGTTLSLYLFDPAIGRYRLEGAAAFTGPVETGDRFWLVGQGMYENELVNQTCGLIDEVRISNIAVKPNQLLFSASSATNASQATLPAPVAEKDDTGVTNEEK